MSAGLIEMNQRDFSFEPIVCAPPNHTIKPSVVAGKRAVALVSASEDSIHNISAAPVEMFKKVEIDGLGTRTKVCVYPNHIEKLHTNGTAKLRTRFFAARNEPWFGVLMEFDSDAGGFVSLRLEPHLDYISKFLSGSGQICEMRNGRIEVSSPEHREIKAAVITDGGWENFRSGIPVQAYIRFSKRMGYIVFAGGEVPRVDALLDTMNMAALNDEFEQVVATCSSAINGGAQLETPDTELNRFFSLSRIWFIKSLRTLPFGDPYGIDATMNREVDVLTASPDYHGVFANDNVQTSLEGYLVCPQMVDVFRNDCDVLLNHSRNCEGYVPEAVEFFKGRPELFIQGLKIGQHPEWIVSVASLVLLTGNREIGEGFWVGIELALGFFQDSNGDGVGEWDTAGYPEQPDTTGYRSGMLYAQTWWVWAFGLASELAAFLGKHTEASDLERRGTAAMEALERVFGTGFGYGSWLSGSGALHPHRGHCMILPVALGLASGEGSHRVLHTVQSEDMWNEPFGALRADKKSGINGGAWVWAFMRWNLISALFRGGEPDRAAQLAGAWSRQELSAGLPAMESYPTPITGITGQGYLWTAGRAIRALTYGMFGIGLHADGISFNPSLPRGWPEMMLTSLPYRGSNLSVSVKRLEARYIALDGRELTGNLVPAELLHGEMHRIDIGVA